MSWCFSYRCYLECLNCCIILVHSSKGFTDQFGDKLTKEVPLNVAENQLDVNWIFHIKPRRDSKFNWIGIKIGKVFSGNGQNYNWLGSSRFDFWQEKKINHIIDWSRYSKLGEIIVSVVRFHLLHFSVQVTTWWWSKSPSGLIGAKGICIKFIGNGLHSGVVTGWFICCLGDP